MELCDQHFSKLHGNLWFDPEQDTYEMFAEKKGSRSMHLNYLTFRKLFSLMPRDSMIVETGMASAGTNSTYLFNEYVRKYGGRFWSVDINPELANQHRGNMCPGTTLVTDDSVAFLQNWVKSNTYCDVAYLDSWDLDWYHPKDSEEHGIREYHALLPSLKSRSLLLIDDTPISPKWLDTRGRLYTDMSALFAQKKYLPGKGRLILSEPKSADILEHQYQLLYRFR